MNFAPFFNAQFVDTDGTLLVGGKLYTYLSGTVTPHPTYQDQAGLVPNTDPIILDSAGQCRLLLDPAVEYTFALYRADDTLVKTWDDIAGVATAAGVVISVNGMTGTVLLTADDIPHATGTSTTWFTATDVGAAIDEIINRVDSAIDAASVQIADVGGLYTATNVEAALQELGTALGGVDSFPSQTGNAGKYLKTDGTSPSWAAPIPSATGQTGKFLSSDGTNAIWASAQTGTSTQLENGHITFPGGLIMQWGTTSTIATDDATNSVTFPTPFPNSCFAVMVCASTDMGVSGAGVRYSMAATAKTISGFNVVNDGDASTATWIAIGN